MITPISKFNNQPVFDLPSKSFQFPKNKSLEQMFFSSQCASVKLQMIKSVINVVIQIWICVDNYWTTTRTITTTTTTVTTAATTTNTKTSETTTTAMSGHVLERSRPVADLLKEYQVPIQRKLSDFKKWITNIKFNQV